MQSKAIAQAAGALCVDKKGEDVLILDIRKISDLSEYFVIASGMSTRHVRALADNIIDGLRSKKVRVWHVDGLNEGTWIVLDYGGVIVHLFQSEIRTYYNLEHLWGDAPRVTC